MTVVVCEVKDSRKLAVNGGVDLPALLARREDDPGDNGTERAGGLVPDFGMIQRLLETGKGAFLQPVPADGAVVGADRTAMTVRPGLSFAMMKAEEGWQGAAA